MNFNYVFMPIVIFVAGIFIIWLSSRRIFAVSKKTYPPWRKIVERAVLSIVIVFAFAIAGYTAFNAIAVRSFWSRNPAPGRIVGVGGYGMHIDCTGNGSPVLILEAGGQNDSTIWRAFNQRLRKQPPFAPTIELVLAGAILSRARAMLTISPLNCASFYYRLG